MNKEQLVVDEDIDVNSLDIATGPKPIDIFQHIKYGIKNAEINCNCDSDIVYYCIPCKCSCCLKCNLALHKKHLLVEKKQFILNDENIKKSYDDIENSLTKSDLFMNYNQKKNDLISQIQKTSDTLRDKISEWQKKKTNEITEVFDELQKNLELINSQKSQTKKNIKDFYNKNKNFFHLDDKNKDINNTIFLISYDMLNISRTWSHNLSFIIKEIERNYETYNEKETEKNKYLITEITNILSKIDDEDLTTHEKIDEKLLPIVKFKLEIKNLDNEPLKQVDSRITKISSAIDTLKKNVFLSIKKFGTYREIARENSSMEHKKLKGIDNLFSQRKFNGPNSPKSEFLSIIPNKNIKQKNDISLDNQIVNRYYAHIMLDLYDACFKMNSTELQSSHADLKIKTPDDDDTNVGKIIEGTNNLMIYDKKMNQITKKSVKLTKNPFGYTKFPFGCRSILIGDRFYITGGRDETQEYANVIIYDRKTGLLKRIMDMQQPRSYHTLIFNNVFETIMVIGGENCNGVEIFDPLTNRWQIFPMLNIPRANPLFFFDESRGNMYTLFGIEGSYLGNNYIDSIEKLDLTNIRNGWVKVNYNNKVNFNFKCYLNIYQLNDDMVLIYGGVESRDSKRNACIFNIPKNEMIKINKAMMSQLRDEAKNNKRLSTIITAVRSSPSTENLP